MATIWRMLNPPKVMREMPSSDFLRQRAMTWGTKRAALPNRPRPKMMATICFMGASFGWSTGGAYGSWPDGKGWWDLRRDRQRDITRKRQSWRCEGSGRWMRRRKAG